MEDTKENKFLNYFLVYMLIASTGIDFFFRVKMTLLIPMLFVVAGIFFYKKLKIDKFIIVYVSIFILVQFLQMIKFYFLPTSTFLGLHIRVLYAYFTIRIVGERFFKYYVNILYYSTLISFFFYFISYIPGVENFFVENITPLFRNPLIDYNSYNTVFPSVIVYTFNAHADDMVALLRNSGPFWEPGAFAGFLVIGIIFNTIIENDLFSKKNLWLLFGLLTTVSTTGLIVIMFFIFSYVMTNSSIYIKILIIPLILFGSVYAFTTLDFLGTKVTEKMNIEDAGYNTRFTSAYLDFMDTLENPILGLGRAEKTRFKGETDEFITHRNNGVTNFLVYYGFIIFACYFFLIYYTFRKMCMHYNFRPTFALYAIGMIFLIGFSEGYFTRPLFFGLTMMHILLLPLSKYKKSGYVGNTELNLS
jgi:hypothetical protein